MKSKQYVVSGDYVPRDRAVYVPRSADKQTHNLLIKSTNTVVLTSSRQTGKTSLARGFISSEALVVINFDFRDFSAKEYHPEKWFKIFFQILAIKFQKACNIAEKDTMRWFETNYKKGIPRKFLVNYLREVVRNVIDTQKKILLIFDEIDLLMSFRTVSDDFFHCIQFLDSEKNQLNVSTFLLGIVSPHILISNSKRSDIKIGTENCILELPDFDNDPKTFRIWAEGLYDVPIKKQYEVIKEVLNFTGGQPYLMNVILNRINIMAKKTIVDIPLIIEKFILEQSDFFKLNQHFKAAMEFITTLPNYSFSAITEYEKILNEPIKSDSLDYEKAEFVIPLLKIAGLIRIENGIIDARNYIYRRVFNKKWVEFVKKKLGTNIWTGNITHPIEQKQNLP